MAPILLHLRPLANSRQSSLIATAVVVAGMSAHGPIVSREWLLEVAPFLLTVAFWACSLAVLAMRWHSPAFCALVRYGGRVVTAANKEATNSGGKPKSSSPLAILMNLAAPCVSAVDGSFLGTVRIRRKTSFVAFYLVGSVSTLVLLLRVVCRSSDGPVVVTALPLACFGLHCGWRLAETLRLFRFRPKAEDNVSLFAAMSGAIFYVFAALSSCPGRPQRQPTGGKASAAVVCLLSLLYTAVQLAQARAHAALAGLRANPSSPSSQQIAAATAALHTLPASARQSAAAAAVADILREPKLLSYRLPSPRRCRLFALALEPHYGCEAALYAVNLASVVAVGPAAGLRAACAAGVLAFTVLNLATTAGEHRRFWDRANAVRRGAMRAVVEAGDALVVEVCRPALKEEHLPRWNIRYGIW